MVTALSISLDVTPIIYRNNPNPSNQAAIRQANPAAMNWDRLWLRSGSENGPSAAHMKEASATSWKTVDN